MIRNFICTGERLQSVVAPPEELRQSVWIDLASPTPGEEALLEQALGIEIPTHEDMQEIEASSRMWRNDHALYLTAQILAARGPDRLEIGPVNFMIQPERLITVHYHSPGSFAFFADWAAQHDTSCSTGTATFLGLMEAVVDRLADILENEARGHDQLTRAIFETRQGSGDDLSGVIRLIGRAEDRNGKISESLATVQRILTYLATPGLRPVSVLQKGAERDQLKSLIQDLRSLREVARVQSEKIRFQLDATLGVINIRQADIIKIFSVVAFVFLPPTLIASVYGMNFEHMPELSWRFGYPAALGLMLLSAIVPWALFRWKKWL